MNISESIQQVAKLFGQTEIPKEIDQFVPYFYLDGHRTGAARLGMTSAQGYANGADFFYRIVAAASSIGINNCVAMIHTKRNQKSRVDNVSEAISSSADLVFRNILKYNHRFYGDLTDQIELHAACAFLEKMEQKSDVSCHLLINYSEKWAIENFDCVEPIPKISSVVRFTKGNISGGSIPSKMDNSVFVYVQNASMSISWSDEQIVYLLLIQLFNWSATNQYIGNKEYSEGEAEMISKAREENLLVKEYDLSGEIKSTEKKLVLTFNETGVVKYVI